MTAYTSRQDDLEQGEKSGHPVNEWEKERQRFDSEHGPALSSAAAAAQRLAEAVRRMDEAVEEGDAAELEVAAQELVAAEANHRAVTAPFHYDTSKDFEDAATSAQPHEQHPTHGGRTGRSAKRNDAAEQGSSKRSVSMPAATLRAVQELADAEGVSVSRWMTQAADERAARERRAAATRAYSTEYLADYEAEHGPVPAEAIAAARQALGLDDEQAEAA